MYGTIRIQGPGRRLSTGAWLACDEFIRRDFAFCEHARIPVPYAKPAPDGDDTGFFLTPPARSPTDVDAVWYIVGVRVPVPCVDVTVWYNGQRQVTIAPGALDVTYAITPIAVVPGTTVRISQNFGLHGVPRPQTHVLTLAGYFLRDELYALPVTEAVRPPC